jgi:phosphoglycolate phosphatase-like HAD superfamily hydrolase
MPLNSSRIRAICFDIDGTLSDTDDLWIQRALPAVQPVQIFFPTIQPQTLARRLIMGLETPGNFVYFILDCVGLDSFAGRVYNWINHVVLRPRPKKYLMVPGTKETIESLATRFPLSVVSSRDRIGTLDFLETFELQPHFKAIATSQTCRYTKPFPDPIIWAAQQMGVEPHECLMVGDTVVDIRAGKAAGAQTVGVLCGFGEEKELLRAGADLILLSPAHLLSILQITDSPLTVSREVI